MFITSEIIDLPAAGSSASAIPAASLEPAVEPDGPSVSGARPVLNVQFHDQRTRNSFSLAAAEELHALLVTRAGGYRGILFRALGPQFCSGGNLADYGAMTGAEEGKAVNRRIADILGHLSTLPVPTVALIEGDCFGGGVELLSAFDFVVAAPHTRFALWQKKIGLTFGWGGGARLEKRLGVQRLRQLALSARPLNAYEALACGLIDQICPVPLLERHAWDWLRTVLATSQAPVASLKTWNVERELAIFESLWWSTEHQAALARFKTTKRVSGA